MTVRARCRVCLAPRALTSRGLVWAHRAHGAPDRVHCPGARLAPLGAALAAGTAEPVPLPGQVPVDDPLVREYPGGTIYLLHFHDRFAHAGHYLGWASPGNLRARLAWHGTIGGANLLWHVARAGIGWSLVRTWPGDRTLERRLKVQGTHVRKCPVCRPELAARLLLAAAV